MRNTLVQALLSEFSDEDLEWLTEVLAPRLADRLQPSKPWVRGAAAIARHLGCPRSRVYGPVTAGEIPCVVHDGAALCAKRSELDEWLRNGGGKRA